MPTTAATWALAYGALAALAVWGRHPQRLPVHWFSKPATTALLFPATLALAAPSPTRTTMLAGLVACLLGDLALMHPRGFLPGVGCFFVGQLGYAWAFSLETPVSADQLAYAAFPYALAWAAVLRLWPMLGTLRWPAAIYAVALATTCWRALARFENTDVPVAAWAAGTAGALLFMVSDTMVARRRFLGPGGSYALELGTYYVAQWFLFASLWR